MDAKSISGYVLKKKLGAGAMATVFLATEEKLQRDVALKIMSPKLAKDSEFVDRFLREARIAAAFAHQNIVRVFDVGSHGGYHYMAMELLPGGDLSSKLKQGVDLESAIGYVKDIAEGLGYAASKNCIHRDIKPDNIMFAEDGRAVITDFGIARDTTAEANMTIAGSVIGTPQYMSPEQANGEELDYRTDLYSLGIILYEILVGIPPFKGDSAISTGLMHVTQPVPNLPSKYAQFQAFIDKALAKKPQDRFQSSQEFIEALSDINLDFPEDDDSSTLIIGSDDLHKARQAQLQKAEPKIREFKADEFNSDLSLIEEEKPDKQENQRDSERIASSVKLGSKPEKSGFQLPGTKVLVSIGLVLLLLIGHTYYVNILGKPIYFDVAMGKISNTGYELTGKRLDLSGVARALSAVSNGLSSVTQLVVSSKAAESKQEQFISLFNEALDDGRLFEPRLDCAQVYLNELIRLDSTHPAVEKYASELLDAALDEAGNMIDNGEFDQAAKLLQLSNEAMLYVQDTQLLRRYELVQSRLITLR